MNDDDIFRVVMPSSGMITIDEMTEKIAEKAAKEIDKQCEEALLKATVRLGIEVNDENLLRALQADSRRYRSAYEHGMKDAMKHGFWSDEEVEVDGEWWACVTCSVCHNYMNRSMKQFPHCPWCGANMEELQDDV